MCLGRDFSADLTCWCQGSGVFLEGHAGGKEETGCVGGVLGGGRGVVVG